MRRNQDHEDNVSDFEEFSHHVAEAFMYEFSLKDYEGEWIDDEEWESELTLMDSEGRKSTLHIKLHTRKLKATITAGSTKLGTYAYTEAGLRSLERDLQTNSKFRIQLNLSFK